MASCRQKDVKRFGHLRIKSESVDRLLAMRLISGPDAFVRPLQRGKFAGEIARARTTTGRDQSSVAGVFCCQ